MKGYTGKVLLVDLSSGTYEVEKICDSVYERYLSGIGLAVDYLYKRIPADADPLGEENMLGLVSGLLTGTGAVMCGRWLAVAKSPLTGGWGDANCGGTFAPGIKQCGYDAIFVRGISEKPVYIYVDNKNVEIRDAHDYWGLDAHQAEEKLIKDCTTKKKPVVVTIGTAGEKLSLISGITNDFGRIAARSGLGAVMGSKKLKAVVCNGTKPIGCDNAQKVKELSKEFGNTVKKQNIPKFLGNAFPYIGTVQGKMSRMVPLDSICLSGILKQFGTAMNNTLALTNGDAPIKNWKGTTKDFGFKEFKEMNPLVTNSTEYKKYHCYSCVIGCGGVCDIKKASKGEFEHTHKPEYETVNGFGALLLNKDHESILYINELLNRAGMDSISAAGTVAYAIESYEAGKLTKEQTDGLDLTWGNKEAIIKLVKKMIDRDGIGDVLADGVKKAVQRIGENTKEYAIHCGGQEAGMHDARLDPMLGVHFSADPTPGKHTTGAGLYYNMMKLWKFSSWAPRVTIHKKDEEYIPSEKEALKSVAMAAYKMVLDGAGGCYYAMLLGTQHWNVFEFLNAATGWNKTVDEYLEIGKRIQTTRQAFNIKHGVDPKNFIMGKRMSGVPPLKHGPTEGRTVPIKEMVAWHWKAFGWNEKTGVPLEETMVRYGIGRSVSDE